MGEAKRERQMRASVFGDDYYLAIKPPLSREELDRLPLPTVEIISGLCVYTPEEVEENGSQVLGYGFSDEETRADVAMQAFMKRIAPLIGVAKLDTTIYPGINPHHLFDPDEVVVKDVVPLSKYA